MSINNTDISTNGAINTDLIRPTRLEVDLDSLAWNIRQIKNGLSNGALICASLKANAYGHGAVHIAPTLLANGADMFSVAFLDEALELRAAGIDAPILILGALERPRAREVISNCLIQSISSYSEAVALSEESARTGVRASVHIKLDTGMGRLGFVYGNPSAADDILAACALPGIRAVGVFTHFATADEADPSYAERQLHDFISACADMSRRGLDIPFRHCSNSAAIAGFPHAHFNMVRPGIALYGGAGALPGAFHRDLSLRRVMSLRTRIALVKSIPAGASVGYGRRFIARRPTRIATLPIGYGDGYNRGLSCGAGSVLIGGERAPVAGLICMDQCMVDVTDILSAQIDGEAVLFGKQGANEITLEEIAQALGTIPYEVMCAISRRVPRLYLKSGGPTGCVNYVTGFSRT